VTTVETLVLQQKLVRMVRKHHRCKKNVPAKIFKNVKNVEKYFLKRLKTLNKKTLVIICLTFCLLPNTVGAVYREL